jgi:hypothetical protein
VVALEPAHGPPCAAVIEPVRPDVQQSLDMPHDDSLLSKTEDAVIRAVAMIASVCRDQRPPRVRSDLSVREQVMVALEVLDSALGVGAEDAVVRHAQQALYLDHQVSGAPGAQDGARNGVAVRSVRRLRDNQRRGRKTEARERAQRPSERMKERVTHNDPTSVLGRVY